MRDRSTMPPEEALFGSDDRTLEQRYEDVRLERDELEVKVQDLTELLSGLLLRGDDPWEILHRFTAVTAADRCEPMRRAAKTRQANRARRSGVVYYVAMNGRVKIGFTTSFVSRMNAFHAQREDVLAVEPGGQDVETARHAQFATDRVAGTELFEHSEALDDHIVALRCERPDPWISACQLNGLTP